MKRLLLLGGGYGNMRIMHKLLPNTLPKDYEIILVDEKPFHGLKTEYYALAAGTKSDKEVRMSFPEHERLSYVYGEVSNIDLDKQLVTVGENQVDYDILVIGLGSEDKFHNVPGAKEYSYTIQRMNNARRTLKMTAELPSGSTVGVVGAGLSGIEIASELRESRKDINIKLFDRGERILPDFPARLSKYVERWFIENNVEVIPHSNITKVDQNKLYNNEEAIKVDASIWTAGIQPVEVVRRLDIEKAKSGRIKVNQYHQIPTDEKVYIVGDCADLPFPPTAQTAELQAEQIVDVFKYTWADKELPGTMPSLKVQGMIGSLGSKEGFAYIKETTVTGRIARILKSGVLWMYKLNAK